MLDIKFIIENPQKVKNAIINKGITQIGPTDVDKIIQLKVKLSDLQQQIEQLRAERNKNANILKKNTGTIDPQSNDFQKLVKIGKELKQQIANHESKQVELETQFTSLMSFLPGIPSDDTPIGKDESGNIEIETWGTKPKFTFTPRDHIELGLLNNMIDLDRGKKVSGFRGYFLKNDGLMMQWAVLTYAMQQLMTKGYELISPPTLVHSNALFGSGSFPWGKAEVYQVYNPGKDETGQDIKDPLYLVGTSEVSLMAMHSNETFLPGDLPKKYVGFSPCYRSEIGGYHQDVKGLYRIHEFMKMEQVIICDPNTDLAEQLHEEITQNAKDLLQALKIPYRLLAMCTGDMGEPQYKKFDIESWMPARPNKEKQLGNYGETHSSSQMADFQCRRNNIRVKQADGTKKYAFSLNNTMCALPRLLIALWENYQQADGSIKVPDILVPLMGKTVIKNT